MTTATITQVLENENSTNASTVPVYVGQEVPTPGGPDIIYHPDEAKWRARTARRLNEDPSLPDTPLPEGFPAKLESPLVWEGGDFVKGEQEWTYDLSVDELREIDEALKYFKALDKPQGFLSPSTFPLPKLGPVLRGLSKELHAGRGFFVLRTIPVDSYPREDDNSHRHGAVVISHIKDLSNSHPADSIGSPAYTTDKQVFHTDHGDIVSLLALETAAEGGLSRIASSWKVYNEIADSRPDLIKTLSDPWPVDQYGLAPVSLRPILYYRHGKAIINYARRSFTGFLGLPRTSGLPHITEAQAEALDTLHFLGEKHNLALNFQKGDIQYVNNLAVFHARDRFTDTPEKTRHLARLWLRDEELGWKTPDELVERWRKLYHTATPEQQQFPVDPYIRDESKGTGKLST